MYKFYFEISKQSKQRTVEHFMKEGIAKSTLYDILHRIMNGKPAQRQIGSGKKVILMSSNKLEKVKSYFNHKSGVSLRQAASKFKILKSYVYKVLHTKTSIRKRKKTTIQKRSDDKIWSAKTQCGLLYRKFSQKMFILDDRKQ